MNFIFISPHFPHTYWQFCQRLSQNGVRVLGIADAPYDQLKPELREALTEYYRVDSLEDYDEVLSRYGDRMVMCERMPELFAAAMGQQMYTVRLDSLEEVKEFAAFVHEKLQ